MAKIGQRTQNHNVVDRTRVWLSVVCHLVNVLSFISTRYSQSTYEIIADGSV